MPDSVNLAKAELQEIEWNEKQQPKRINEGQSVKVQFNPETMTVSFANQKAGGDQRGGSAFQFVGQGTTKLTLDLWFDVTRPMADGKLEATGDVRELTKKVAYFITPKAVKGKDDEWIAPGVRFVWGTFLFDGIMDSMAEKLEFFSEEGKPLRAMLSVSLSSQMIQFEFNRTGGGGSASPTTPGQKPLQRASAGDTVQGLAAAGGNANAWKSIATANDIENPRLLPEGVLIDVRNR